MSICYILCERKARVAALAHHINAKPWLAEGRDEVQGVFAAIGALAIVILFGWLVSGNGPVSEEWKLLLVTGGLFGSVLAIIVLSWDYIISDQP